MLTRAFQRLIAKIGIAAVLFTQLAVAAYACPALMNEDESAPAAMANDQHAAMPCCEALETGISNICLQHCQAGYQSVQSAPQVMIPPVATMPLAIIEPVQPVSGPGVTVLSALLERETSPPPLLRFRFFRI